MPCLPCPALLGQPARQPASQPVRASPSDRQRPGSEKETTAPSEQSSSGDSDPPPRIVTLPNKPPPQKKTPPLPPSNQLNTSTEDEKPGDVQSHLRYTVPVNPSSSTITVRRVYVWLSRCSRGALLLSLLLLLLLILLQLLLLLLLLLLPLLSRLYPGTAIALRGVRSSNPKPFRPIHTGSSALKKKKKEYLPCIRQYHILWSSV